MATYIIQSTHIRHGVKGEKVAQLYGPGDEIQLTEKEAKALGGNVKPIKDMPKNKDPERKSESKGPDVQKPPPPAQQKAPKK